jgi:hypothetical protein
VPGRPVAFVGDPVALVGDAVALLSSDLGLVQGLTAAGQVGLGGLQGLLGGLGAGLGLPHPGIVQGQGGQPPALGILDDLLGHLGQLARGRPSRDAELLEGRLGVDALGGGQHPFGLLDPDPAGQRLPQLGHLQLPDGQLHAGVDQLAGHRRELGHPSSSWAVQARGWVL